MEPLFLLILGLLSTACVVLKLFFVHRGQQGLAHLEVDIRDYQAVQRELKGVLQEENRVRAREQGLARNEARLLKELGKIRHQLVQLQKEDGLLAEKARRRPTQVER